MADVSTDVIGYTEKTSIDAKCDSTRIKSFVNQLQGLASTRNTTINGQIAKKTRECLREAGKLYTEISKNIVQEPELDKQLRETLEAELLLRKVYNFMVLIERR